MTDVNCYQVGISVAIQFCNDAKSKPTTPEKLLTIEYFRPEF